MTEPAEIFTRAPLSEVAYQIRFPSMFYIPQAIGEFQIKIMDDFPKASQLLTTQFSIEDGVPKFPGGKPIQSWQFETENEKTKVIIKLDSVLVSSMEYNSYDQSPGMKFRDLISRIINEFLQKFPIKKFTRIGLRYVDHCPLDEKTNEYFKKYYVPKFDIENYKIDNLIDSRISLRTRRDNYNLLFQCRIAKIKDIYKYIMDFDAYAENVESANYLSITDDLRKLNKSEFYSCITEDFKQYMRGS